MTTEINQVKLISWNRARLEKNSLEESNLKSLLLIIAMLENNGMNVGEAMLETKL